MLTVVGTLYIFSYFLNTGTVMQASHRGLTTRDWIVLACMAIVCVAIDLFMMVPWTAIDWAELGEAQAALPIVVCAIITGGLGTGAPLFRYALWSVAGAGRGKGGAGRHWAASALSAVLSGVLAALALFVVTINVYATIRDHAGRLAAPGMAVAAKKHERHVELEAKIKAGKIRDREEIARERLKVEAMDADIKAAMTERGRSWMADLQQYGVKLTIIQAEGMHNTIQAMAGILFTLIIPHCIASLIISGAKRSGYNSLTPRHWFDELFVTDPQMEVTKEDAYKVYATDCMVRGAKPMTKPDFGIVFEGRCLEAGGRYKKSPSRRVCGVGIKTKGHP